MKDLKFKLSSKSRFKDNKEDIPDYIYQVITNDNKITVQWTEDGEIKQDDTFNKEEIYRNIKNGSWIIIEE